MDPSVAASGVDVAVSGTALEGYVTTTYAVLAAAFGAPVRGPRWVLPRGTRPDKSSCMWAVRFNDGAVATIYDYHYPKRTAKGVYVWHIGGFDHMCLDAVRAALPADVLVETHREFSARVIAQGEARKAASRMAGKK